MQAEKASVENLNLTLHVAENESYLVSIHKWSFLRCTAFSAGLRLRRTLSTPHRKPLCGLVQHKKSSFLNWTLQSAII